MAASWSLTSLREKPIKIGTEVVSHGRYVMFQTAEVSVSSDVQRNPVADCPVARAACASKTKAVARRC
jgi:hypothetical protein